MPARQAIAEWIRKRPNIQFVVALAAIALALWASAQGLAVFHSPPPELIKDKEPSFWFFLLSDRTTLGFFRLGVIMLALYLVASIPALVVGGRWLKAFGTTGLTADDAAKAAADVESLEKQVAQLKEEKALLVLLLRLLQGVP